MMAQSLRNAALCLAIGVALLGCEKSPRPGTVKDEALEAGLKADKNGRVEKLGGRTIRTCAPWTGGNATPDEAVHKAVPFLSKEEAWKAYNRGRNNWVVWTAWQRHAVGFLGEQFLRRLRSVEDRVFPSEHPVLREQEG